MMSPPVEGPEFLVPSSTQDITNQSFILVLRGIHDTLKRVEEAQREVREAVRETKLEVNEVRERLIKIETADIPATFKEYNSRLSALEADKNRRDGAVGFIGWLSTNWPFLAVVGTMLYLVLKMTGALPH